MLFWMESLIRHYRALIRLKKPWINIITINRVVYGLKENRAQKNSKSTLSYLDVITLFSRIAEYVHNVISCRLRIRTYVIWKTTHLYFNWQKWCSKWTHLSQISFCKQFKFSFRNQYFPTTVAIAVRTRWRQPLRVRKTFTTLEIHNAPAGESFVNCYSVYLERKISFAF